jgi:hypothetical protein
MLTGSGYRQGQQQHSCGHSSSNPHTVFKEPYGTMVTTYISHIVEPIGSCLALRINGSTCQAAASVVVFAVSHPKIRD